MFLRESRPAGSHRLLPFKMTITTVLLTLTCPHTPLTFWRNVETRHKKKKNPNHRMNLLQKSEHVSCISHS